MSDPTQIAVLGTMGTRNKSDEWEKGQKEEGNAEQARKQQLAPLSWGQDVGEAEKSGTDEGFARCSGHTKRLGISLNSSSCSTELGWGLRLCISKDKLPGDADDVGPRAVV